MSTELHTSNSRDDRKLRFSNYWKMFLLSLVPWIMIYSSLQYVANERGYDSIAPINQDLDNFLSIMILGLIFTSMGMTATSYYTSNLEGVLQELPIVKRESSDRADKDKIDERWYSGFLKDTLRLDWVLLYFLPISVISLPIHYFAYGHLVVSEFGWIFYIVTIVALLWSNIFVGSWLIWFITAQYLHIYRFHTEIDGSIEGKHHFIGIEKLSEGESKDWPRRKKILARILPIKVDPKEIDVDVFNVDDLAGLRPLANLLLTATILLGFVAAILIPLLILISKLIALVLLPLIFFGIAIGYLIGIASLRDAIRQEKGILLEKINKQLSMLARSIIETDRKDESSELSSSQISERNERFQILDEMGKRISDLPESPKNLTALVRIIPSGLLPLISFISIDQLGIFI